MERAEYHGPRIDFALRMAAGKVLNSSINEPDVSFEFYADIFNRLSFRSISGERVLEK